MTGGIEHAGKQRRERDEQDIGKDHAPEFHGQVKALGSGKAFGGGVNQRGHEDERQTSKHQKDKGQPGKRLGGEAFGTFLRLQPFGKHRHEGRVERAFGKEAAEHVGQAECRDKGVHHRARADQAKDQHLAHDTQNAAQERPEPDGKDA